MLSNEELDIYLEELVARKIRTRFTIEHQSDYQIPESYDGPSLEDYFRDADEVTDDDFEYYMEEYASWDNSL